MEMSREWKTIRLRCLKVIYERQVVREEAPAYLQSRRISRPEDVYELLHDLQRETKEHFLTLHLDGKNRIICLDRVSTGSLNQSIVHPREVFKGALLSSAAAVVLVHNHPSGDPTPSTEDREITRRLREVGDLVGIKVLDHVIVGEDRYVSFSELGII